MKKHLFTALLTVGLCLLCACRSNSNSPAQESDATVPIPYEETDWNTVSIEPADYGITEDMLAFIDEPKWSELTLAELCAYSLHTDGAGSEGAHELLYQRFMEAPHTVLNYFALIGEQVARGGETGEKTAVTELCSGIASADVVWYGSTEEFSAIMEQYQVAYTTGRIAEILATLQSEHDAAVQRAAQKVG